MRLLFDQNLSRHLVEQLEDTFPGSAHVAGLGLETATDREIWDFAAAHDYLITSKDSDFRQLAFLLGPPPKVVWLAVGNATTGAISHLLRTTSAAIARFAESEEEALLVLRDLRG